MSAECYECGSDLVYPAGKWPVGECPVCSVKAELARVRAALDATTEALREAEDALKMAQAHVPLAGLNGHALHRAAGARTSIATALKAVRCAALAASGQTGEACHICGKPVNEPGRVFCSYPHPLAVPSVVSGPPQEEPTA